MSHKVLGGHAQATKKLVQLWSKQVFQDGITLDGCSDSQVRIAFKPTFLFISDLDAQRSVFQLKGSAGLRACFKCKNLVHRMADRVQNDDYFVDISCPSRSAFQLATDAEVFEAIDFLATVQRRREEHEKHLGFRYSTHVIWSDVRLRSRLPPSSVFADPFHIFWVKGIFSLEINLFIQALTAIVRDASFFFDALRKVPFEANGCTATSGHARSLLVPKLFTGEFYKGSGRQTQSCMWLLMYGIKEILGHDGELGSQISSFMAATDVARVLRKLRYASALSCHFVYLCSILMSSCTHGLIPEGVKREPFDPRSLHPDGS